MGGKSCYNFLFHSCIYCKCDVSSLLCLIPRVIFLCCWFFPSFLFSLRESWGVFSFFQRAISRVLIFRTGCLNRFPDELSGLKSWLCVRLSDSIKNSVLMALKWTRILALSKVACGLHTIGRQVIKITHIISSRVCNHLLS